MLMGRLLSYGADGTSAAPGRGGKAARKQRGGRRVIKVFPKDA